MKTNIKIIKNKEIPETVELLAKSIIQISDISQKILNSGLSERALVLLLHDLIGTTKISKSQIALVLNNIPRLKGWYVR